MAPWNAPRSLPAAPPLRGVAPWPPARALLRLVERLIGCGAVRAWAWAAPAAFNMEREGCRSTRMAGGSGCILIGRGKLRDELCGTACSLGWSGWMSSPHWGVGWTIWVGERTMLGLQGWAGPAERLLESGDNDLHFWNLFLRVTLLCASQLSVPAFPVPAVRRRAMSMRSLLDQCIVASVLLNRGRCQCLLYSTSRGFGKLSCRLLLM